MLVTAYFSEDGLPKTGLSPTLDIIDLSDNSIVVNGEAMSEVGSEAVKLLIEQIMEQVESSRKKMILKADLIVRDSCGSRLPGRGGMPVMTAEEQLRSQLYRVPRNHEKVQLPQGVDDKKLLKWIARDTWGYFRDIVSRKTGLPSPSAPRGSRSGSRSTVPANA